MRSLLKELVRMGGKIALEHYRPTGGLQADAKGRNDYVSHVDRRIEEALTSRIRANYPDHLVLGEETHEAWPRPILGPTWIIDPLDGTTNYLHGLPAWSISVAFCEDYGEPRMGAVFDPLRQELFLAERHAGVTLNDQRVYSSACCDLAQAVIAQAMPFKNMAALSDVAAAVAGLQARCNDSRRFGSAALDLAYVAAGRLDAYWELGIHPWDIAAGALMVRCAGGRTSDLAGAADDLSHQRSIIAAASDGLHAAMVTQLASLQPWLQRPPYTGLDRDQAAD